MKKKNRFLGFLLLPVLACALPLVGSSPAAKTDDDDHLKKGEFIPTGVHITPGAAKGSLFQPLNPGLSFDPTFTVGQAVTTSVSPDGKTLLILTSGYNSQNFTSGPDKSNTNPAESNEYVFVYDISGTKPLKIQVLQVPNAFDGMAFNPTGQEFYVSGGPDDTVHVFVKGDSVWTEDARSPIVLGNGKALFGISAAAAGIAVTADGQRLVVANYEHDSVSIVDIANRAKLATLSLKPGKGVAGGEYPFWIAIKGNDTAFVTSERDREVVVIDISTARPVVTDRIPLKGQPIRLILNKNQTRLFVAEGSSDTVAVISVNSHEVLEEINTTAPKDVFENSRNYKGSSPNSLALSPDEHSLYVTNGGANDVAVIELAGETNAAKDENWQKSKLVGLIPTGWYPNSVSVSADGNMLYVVNSKSNAGPNPLNCVDKASLQPGGNQNGCSAANQYVWQLTKAGFLTLPVPHGEDLKVLTSQVARNNRYRDDVGHDEQMIAALHNKVQHVIYIVKENRTYDQILGDLDKGNGDPSINVYPQAITPNQHALADKFVDLDNFYDSGEVSGDGWNWSTSARAADTIEKTEPVNYAGRGLNYDYEGTNRNINVGYATLAERQAALPITPSDPNLLPGTADVSALDSPDGEEGAGYLWDSALRAGKSLRNYGFFIDLAHYSSAIGAFRLPLLADPFASGTQVSFATKEALRPVTDIYFRGYDNAFPDFYRVKEWEREFDQFESNGNLPNLEFIRVMHDHTGAFDDPGRFGVNTPELQTADNDYAVGLIVEKVSKSPRYKDNTLIFILEDDSQDGPDHVDAHRSILLVAGAKVKQGAVISKKYTTVSVISTIVDVLGIDHLSLNDADAEPMTDIFTTKTQKWTFSSIIPEILKSSMRPLPMSGKNTKPAGELLAARNSKPSHDASWWAEKTKGFDFSAEDKVNAAAYNRILWQGLMGDFVSYPTARSGQDLRHNRKQLLTRYRKNLQARLSLMGAQNSDGGK
jgi:DNA-binding beta-propeller fold protein YncE